MIKREKGITLIALVVTIVVLLILAGVSISLVLGDNGIINKSKEARDKYAQAEANDQASLDEASDWINEQVGGNGTGGVKLDKNLPSGTGTTPYFPSDDFSHLVGTDLDNGLVIQDPQGNQYVWVEVPRTTTVYPTAGLDLNLNTLTGEELDNAYSNIEKDLHTYTNVYRDGTSYTDTYKEDSTTGWFADEDAYNTAKKNMLKSVYQNGGFWIGKYEAGIETPRTAKGEATTTPLSKANLYPYNYVTRTQAKVLAENMYSGNRTSSLMFGVQWDLVLAFMHNKGEIADSTLTSNSTTIGNYYNNLCNITNTSAKYSTDNGANWKACPKNKDSSASILLTTGADASFGTMNIYDIAGNVWEWTLEKTSNPRNPCVGRGGNCSDSGTVYPAAGRSVDNTTCSYDFYGFRVSLY